MEADERLLPDVPFLPDAHEPFIHVIPVVALVNPNSQKAEQAMRFLRLYSDSMDDVKRQTLFPFEPYTGKNPRVIRAEQAYRDAAAMFCMDCDLYQYILLWEAEIFDIVQPYFDGRATVEEVTEQLDHRVAEAYQRLR